MSAKWQQRKSKRKATDDEIEEFLEIIKPKGPAKKYAKVVRPKLKESTEIELKQAEKLEIEREEKEYYKQNCPELLIVRGKSAWWMIPKSDIEPRDYMELQSANGADETSIDYLTRQFNGKWHDFQRLGDVSDVEFPSKKAAPKCMTFVFLDWI